MTTPPTPADWYPDPENPSGLRYWDGRAWTEHRAPAPTADPMSGQRELAPEEPDGTPADAQPEPVQPDDSHPPVADEPPPEMGEGIGGVEGCCSAHHSNLSARARSAPRQ